METKIIKGDLIKEKIFNEAGAILPIPGGLMTVVMAILFRNTVNSFKNSMIEN